MAFKISLVWMDGFVDKVGGTVSGFGRGKGEGAIRGGLCIILGLVR